MMFRRWGVMIGMFSLTWYDCWDKRFGLEIGWGNQALFTTFND